MILPADPDGARYDNVPIGVHRHAGGFQVGRERQRHLAGVGIFLGSAEAEKG